ncbi:MAG TPA: SDR family NAD(P)-dependent oxidoreductase [Thermoleophilaceae bacterium]|jgi:NAD(P)-dependent dehydrogenase (short-subunit alcohol dehydrogenase family)|nr:SDR family NAD(P)-dependent oxidoreductase [Thermoleophilaceae bacterium]
MTVLVAGGTGFLGNAVVRELIGSGYDVAATWVVERERERLEAEPVSLIEADLFDADQVGAAISKVDQLDAVVNLVGGYSDGPRVHETDPDDFERMLRLNVMPCFLLARAAMPSLIERGGGAFVGVSARPALRPFAGAAGYISSKAAVLALVQALDAEYKGDGIRCNAILPSVIDTPANREAMPGADYSKWVPPEQIAKVVRFLVSDESAPTSGAGIPVYGRA